ncbi:response regulator receiver domain [Pseudomonas syringae pv. syringae]|uniref:response regulator receiver domain n=1 Tax=Pseudomonas syringae TaxID=317 RepID=UPI00200A34DA|nr:response regulator receiver domain [Pseudomonas syringae]MCK9749754.1 response regulator receiver domain [Pseudomonas syringae pv. syringae]MCK9754024.1 response regulator receiver domain [Pseudomonas syringae pv. syringae]
MEATKFGVDRLAAAKEFAQTMIVVDDQAKGTPTGEKVSSLNVPRRGSARASVDSEDDLKKSSTIDHQLDSKLLIDTAMELGLICSVLCPANKDEDIVGRVVKAAERVDIVSLDWEMFGDSGKTAIKLIRGIVLSDLKKMGRLRLISIYTGDKRLSDILASIFNSFDDPEKALLKMRLEGASLSGKDGLKIICLFKKHGTQVLPQFSGFQVSESELPSRLLNEFASIAEGLLSNIALATVASIRSVAHHLISRFNGKMDGPYFLHRASIGTAEDAEQYALDIVLSELKSVVDRDGVARRWAGSDAINNRIDAMAKNEEFLDFHYERDGKVLVAKAPIIEVKQFVISGRNNQLFSFKDEPKPTKKDYDKSFPSVFSTSLKEAQESMYEFACLTGIRSFPGSRALSDGSSTLPILRLGTIIKSSMSEYWLCLQAACDSVRVTKKTAFFFVPLEVADVNPEHVVPILDAKGNISYLGLKLASKAYTKSVSFVFEPILCDASLRVSAVRRNKGAFFFSDTKGDSYLWIADLKQRRALRVSQKVGAELARIGFDEFEPFRAPSV